MQDCKVIIGSIHRWISDRVQSPLTRPNYEGLHALLSNLTPGEVGAIQMSTSVLADVFGVYNCRALLLDPVIFCNSTRISNIKLHLGLNDNWYHTPLLLAPFHKAKF